MPLCESCKNMPHDRCLHQLGRRAATPTTDAYGCGYFTPKVMQARTSMLPLIPELCPRCARPVAIEGDNRICRNCGNAWKGVWDG
jgi:hypothetical protein